MPWTGWRCALPLLLWCSGTSAGRWVEVDFDSFGGPGGGDGGPGGGDGPPPGGGGYYGGGYYGGPTGSPGGGDGGGYGGYSPLGGVGTSTPFPRRAQGAPGGFAGLSPFPSMQHTIVFDEGQQIAIAFGGQNANYIDVGEISFVNMSDRSWSLRYLDYGPIARSGHSAVFDPIDRKMWVYGGKGSDDLPFRGLWSLDEQSVTWTLSHADGPADQSGHTAVWDSQARRMYTFGPVLNHVWYYDDEVEGWFKAEALNGTTPQKRQDHTAVWDPSSKQMWLFGGQVLPSTTLGDLWCFSTQEDNFHWQQRFESGPSARWGHVAAWDEQRQGMWMFAGMGEFQAILQDLWFYSVQADSWEFLPDPPPPSRYAAASVWANGDFWVHGGVGPQSPRSDFWYYMPYFQDAYASAVPFNVTSGDCVAIGHCVKSPNYPEPYGAGSCTISSFPGMRIYALHFRTQGEAHSLVISNRTFSGTDYPSDTVPEGELVWTAEGAGGRGDGWLLCAYDFTVNSGDCTLALDGCVRSPNFPAQYNTQQCEITPRPGLEITSASFWTEANWDRLTVNGAAYSGSNGPSNVIATGEAIQWRPDNIGFAEGWELCGKSIFSVLEGNCTTSANCVQSPGYDDQPYGNNESCIIAASGALPLRAAAFATEEGKDILSVAQHHFSGDRGPDDIPVLGPILWRSDESGTRAGWKICRAPFVLSSGSCKFNETARDCVTSPNYPQPYDNNDECSILPQRGMYIAAVDFRTEDLFDYLTIESVRYSGISSPHLIEVFQPISWFSSPANANTGWQLCRVCDQDEAPGDCVCQSGYEALDGRCQLCQPGSFKQNVSFGLCSVCPGGTSSQYPGATLCSDCGPGEFAKPNASVCSLCPPGRLQPWVRASECMECPQGTYGTSEGATGWAGCLACPDGSTTLRTGASQLNDCIALDHTQQLHCTAGRPCVISGINGTALTDGHLMAITSDRNCSAQKMPVPGIANGGISSGAEENGTLYQWGSALGDFQPVGGVYSLCFCPNVGGITCRNLNEGFRLSAGQLQVSGPVPGGEFQCVRGQRCEFGGVRGLGFSSADRFAAQRAKCGAAGSSGLLLAGLTNCSGCGNESDPAPFGAEASVQLDLGVFLDDPAAYGYYLCWCSGRASTCEDPSEFNVEAGRIQVSGPFTNQELLCSSGQICQVRAVQGLGIQQGDRLMILAACGTGSTLKDFPANGTLEHRGGEFEFLSMAEAALEAEPGIYRVCYCRPADSLSCNAPVDFRASVGLMTVSGPLQSAVFGCWIDEDCKLEVDGLELAVGDLVSLAKHDCTDSTDVSHFGLSNAQLPLRLKDQNGDFEVDFGVLDEHATPGTYELCWCPQSAACTDPLMRAQAGIVQVMCPPGYFSVGDQTGRRCALCPPGFYCPGGLPADAQQMACPPRQSTRGPGKSSAKSCSCAIGYYKLLTGGCQACPRGSYKDEASDASSCDPCPDGQTTYQTGSVDVSACTSSTATATNSTQVPAAIFKLQVQQSGSGDEGPEDAATVVSRIQAIIKNAAAIVSGSTPSSIDVAELSDGVLARRLQQDTVEPDYGYHHDDDGDGDDVDGDGEDGEDGDGDDGGADDDDDDGDDDDGEEDPLPYSGSVFEVTVRHQSATAAETFVFNFNGEAMTMELRAQLEADRELADVLLVPAIVELPRREDVTITCQEGTSASPGRLILSPADCECSPGYGRDVQLGICQLCQIGSFKESVGNSLCQQCPELRTTPYLGAKRMQECICQAGLHVVTLAGAETCAPCPPNYFCPGRAQPQPCRNNSVTTRPGARQEADCVCTAGHYSATDGVQITCAACPTGRYKPNVGDEPCTLNCPANSDSLPGATSAGDCFCRQNYHAVEDANSSQLEICLACSYRGLTCPGGRHNETSAHMQPVAVSGFYQTGQVVAVACDVTMENGQSACQGGNVCASGSTGLLCGECPQGFARNQYPNFCRDCPEDSSLWLGLVILLDLFQKTFLNFVVAAMAATSAIKDSDSLHTSMIRIGTQWMTACSVISHFSIDQLQVFSWTQEQAELQHKQTCAEDGSCAEAVEVVTYSWPEQVTEWFRQAFNIMDIVSKLTSVSFMAHCHSDSYHRGDRVALLLAPGIYFLSLPALAVLNTFMLCALVVYVILPFLRRHGWEFNEAGKRRQKREKAIKKLKKAIAAALEAYGLAFEDVEACGVLEKLALPSLTHGAEEPKPFVAGILELSPSLSVRACLLQVEHETVFVKLLASTELSWEECLQNATFLTRGISQASLTSALQRQNARDDLDLLHTLVKRAFVWKLHDLVEANAEDVNVEELAAAVADSSSLEALTVAASSAPEGAFKALVVAQREQLRTRREESDDEVAITAPLGEAEAGHKEGHKEVDLETLDLGLFTKFPHPGLLLHQCIPVIWVSLIHMWPELLSKFLQMIWCKPVLQEGGSVVQRLQPHPDLECWVGDHVPIAVTAIVGLSVWCLGIPLLLYLSIWRLRDRNTQENYRTYGYFIDGFEPAFWWWDILIKRADVAIMMLVTYTSVADDEKAKLLIYPFISGGQLALTAWCRPFLNNQAEVLDFLEYILSSFRFLFFSGIALLLIFHSQDTLWAMAGVLASMLFLMVFYFIVHVVAQAVRKASKDMEEEEEAAANVFRRKEKAPAKGCTGKIKRWIVNHVLPLIKEAEDEKYLLEWCLESDYVSLVTAAPCKPRSKCDAMFKKVRAWLLRFGGDFQRRVVAKALQEFATLWLMLFRQDGLPTKTLKVLCALTTAKSHVPAKTPKKDVPDLWKNQVKIILATSKPSSSGDGPRWYRFSPDDLMRTTQRLGRLDSEHAVDLVNGVVELLRAERAGRPSIRIAPEPPPNREASDASFIVEHLNLVVAGEDACGNARTTASLPKDLVLAEDHLEL